MPKISYEGQPFNDKSMYIIETADRLLRQYAQSGYKVTARTLYYRFIALDLFPQDWIDATRRYSR